MKDLIIELSHYIAAISKTGSSTESYCEYTPESLVGREILHRFDVNSEEDGVRDILLAIMLYHTYMRLYIMVKKDGVKRIFFNLLEDFSNGDLIINN